MLSREDEKDMFNVDNISTQRTCYCRKAKQISPEVICAYRCQGIRLIHMFDT